MPRTILAFLLCLFSITLHCQNQATPISSTTHAPNTAVQAQEKLINAAQVIKQTNQEDISYLKEYLPILELRKLIAEYALEWKPYREFSQYGFTHSGNHDTTDGSDIQFSDDESRVITIGSNGSYPTHNSYDIQTQAIIQRPLHHTGLSQCAKNILVNFPDGETTNFRVSDLQQPEQTSSWQQNTGDLLQPALSTTVSRNGEWAAYGTYDKIYILNIRDKSITQHALADRYYFTNQIASSPNGKYLAAVLFPYGGINFGTRPNYIHIYEIIVETNNKLSLKTIARLTGTDISRLTAQTPKFDLVFSHTNTTLIIASHIFDLKTKKLAEREFGDPRLTVSTSYSQDQTLCALATEGNISLWHNLNGTHLIQKIEHREWPRVKIKKVSVSPTGRYIALGCIDTIHHQHKIVLFKKTFDSELLV